MPRAYLRGGGWRWGIQPGVGQLPGGLKLNFRMTGPYNPKLKLHSELTDK